MRQAMEEPVEIAGVGHLLFCRRSAGHELLDEDDDADRIHAPAFSFALCFGKGTGCRRKKLIPDVFQRGCPFRPRAQHAFHELLGARECHGPRVLHAVFKRGGQLLRKGLSKGLVDFCLHRDEEAAPGVFGLDEEICIARGFPLKASKESFASGSASQAVICPKCSCASSIAPIPEGRSGGVTANQAFVVSNALRPAFQ